MSIVTPPMLSIQAITGSFFFQTKYIPLPSNIKVVLGSQVQDPVSGSSFPTRRAAPTNGWFAPRPVPSADGSTLLSASPMSLGIAHAEVWCSNGQIIIRDLDSAFGTYVNGTKINTATVLRTGDIVNLGSQLTRNANTPAYVTEEHLKPIRAKVSLIGVPSR